MNLDLAAAEKRCFELAPGLGRDGPPRGHSTSPKGTRVKVTRWAETHCHHADDLGAEVDGRGDSGRDGDSGGVWWEQKR